MSDDLIMKENVAQKHFEFVVNDLEKFCEENTELNVAVLTEQYPVRVVFVPNSQLSIFGSENIDENGETNDLTVTVGLKTSVKSTLRFKMNTQILKKLIKKAEKVGEAYYHAFRESTK